MVEIECLALWLGWNIAKGTTDPRVEFCLPKLLILDISQGQTQSLIKFHLQNIDQAPTSKSRHQQTPVFRLNLKFKILTKPGFRISTKIQLHYLYKTSAAKYWTNSCFKSCLNFNFKILTKPCGQSLNKSLTLWPNLRFQICNKLLPTRSSSSTSATVTTSTSFELASSKARVTSIKFTKQQSVSQSVSQLVS